MNMNFNPIKKITNLKQRAKLEEEKRERESAVARHTDYQEQAKKIDAPFGKTIGTGAHKSKKDYNRTREKYRGGRDY